MALHCRNLLKLRSTITASCFRLTAQVLRVSGWQASSSRLQAGFTASKLRYPLLVAGVVRRA